MEGPVDVSSKNANTTAKTSRLKKPVDHKVLLEGRTCSRKIRETWCSHKSTED